MKAALLVLCLATVPALPALAEPPQDDGAGKLEEGTTLLQEGARLLFEGLAREIEPAMRDMAAGMEDLAANLQPMLRDLGRLIDDMSAYHAPERLPNGDIIIRRKRPGGPLPDGPVIGEDGETEI